MSDSTPKPKPVQLSLFEDTKQRIIEKQRKRLHFKIDMKLLRAVFEQLWLKNDSIRVTTNEIAKLAGISVAHARRGLNILEAAGEIERVGDRSGWRKPDAPLPAQYKTAKKANLNDKHDGYVYLISSVTGHYKIGKTRNPHDRMRVFQVRLPVEVEYLALIQTNNMHNLEKELHERFKDKHINGEWFDLGDDDIQFILSLANRSKDA